MVRFGRLFAVAALALGFSALSAAAVPLTVVNVSAPGINCVFNVTCTITVSDSIGNFTPPDDSGNARLQSRSYTGVAPAPAAGLGGYEYRVDLTGVQGITAVNCVSRLRLGFGKDVKLPYAPGVLADVFVVTGGGLGSVGIASAVALGPTIIFTFTTPVCPGQTSYFFGLASKKPMPVASVVTLTYTLPGTPTGTTAVRVP